MFQYRNYIAVVFFFAGNAHNLYSWCAHAFSNGRHSCKICFLRNFAALEKALNVMAEEI